MIGNLINVQNLKVEKIYIRWAAEKIKPGLDMYQTLQVLMSYYLVRLKILMMTVELKFKRKIPATSNVRDSTSSSREAARKRLTTSLIIGWNKIQNSESQMFFWFQLLKCDELLLFFVFSKSKWRVFGFWQKKQFEDNSFTFWEMFTNKRLIDWWWK